MTQKVKLTAPTKVGGKLKKIGTDVDVSTARAKSLIEKGRAHDPNKSATRQDTAGRPDASATPKA